MRTAEVLTDLAIKEVINLRGQVSTGEGGGNPSLQIRQDQLDALESLFSANANPPTGSVDTPDANTIVVTFSEPIDVGSIFSPGAVSIDNGPVFGISVDPSATAATIKTGNAMVEGSSYNLGLAINTQSGKPLVAQINFTAGSGTSQPPIIARPVSPPLQMPSFAKAASIPVAASIPANHPDARFAGLVR